MPLVALVFLSAGACTDAAESSDEEEARADRAGSCSMEDIDYSARLGRAIARADLAEGDLAYDPPMMLALSAGCATASHAKIVNRAIQERWGDGDEIASFRDGEVLTRAELASRDTFEVPGAAGAALLRAIDEEVGSSTAKSWVYDEGDHETIILWYKQKRRVFVILTERGW